MHKLYISVSVHLYFLRFERIYPKLEPQEKRWLF